MPKRLLLPKMLPNKGKFSLIDTYLQLASAFPVVGYADNSSFWMDVGRPEQLAMAEKILSGQNTSIPPV